MSTPHEIFPSESGLTSLTPEYEQDLDNRIASNNNSSDTGQNTEDNKAKEDISGNQACFDYYQNCLSIPHTININEYFGSEDEKIPKDIRFLEEISTNYGTFKKEKKFSSSGGSITKRKINPGKENKVRWIIPKKGRKSKKKNK